MKLLVAALLLAAAGCDSAPTTRRARAQTGHGEAARSPAPAKSVRPAALAGSWYPADADALRALVDGFVANASPPQSSGPGSIRALISPHAGYEYSGPVAGHGYRAVQGRDIHRVIVLAPSHHVPLHGLSIARRTHYSTPLGEIPLDLEAIGRLRASPLVRTNARAHENEHSIEMQLPLLQRSLRPGWLLVPILVGDLGAGGAERAARLLLPLADERTLVVASSDFTHYGPRYGYEPFPRDERIGERLRTLDMGAYAQIEAKDARGFFDYRARTGITACGFWPILVLLHMLPGDASVTLLRYDTSGRITGDYTNSVSYLSVAFSSRHPLGLDASTSHEHLPQAQMELLHTLALRAVQHVVTTGDTSPDAQALLRGTSPPQALREVSGAFVTLKKRGQLRGCIGAIEGREPLYLSVIHNAVSAAVHDPRFPPVAPDELRSLDVEVSVLTPLREIPSSEEFHTGEQGVVLRLGERRAVFLPEVAIEQGWSRSETLTHLSRKAGLSPEAWRDPAARFWVFTTQAYAAPWTP